MTDNPPATPSIPTSPADSPPTPTPAFDIVAHYNHLLQTDPALTRPIAAIESLIALLSTFPPSTISETLALLESSTLLLKNSVRNPIPLSAGTDLFRRYIISTLQSRSSSANGSAGGKGRRGVKPGEDFKAIRNYLIENSRVFVQRAKEARGKIALVAGGFVREGCTVLTCGSSRVVGTVLERAAGEGVGFRVIHVRHSDSGNGLKGEEMRSLRKKVPVAEATWAALASAVEKADFVMVGAESVVENGGIISGIGTRQVGLLAKGVGKPFYVVAESYKFVRFYPLGGEDLGVGRDVLKFQVDGNGDGDGEELRNGEKGVDGTEARDDSEAVDMTPPELITALVTETGVHTPSAVSEELIKMWY